MIQDSDFNVANDTSVKKRPLLSVVVITYNEATRLAKCLNSVQTLADEIVIVDSGSQDGTVDIARRFTDRVIVTDNWPGYGPQKQRALAAAHGQWVLSLDADEQISPALAMEIRAVMETGTADGYFLPRLTTICGKPVRHGGWFPDYVLRLVQRKHAFFTDDVVHERLCVRSDRSDPLRLEKVLPRLREPILHVSYASLDQLLEKMNRYTTLGAEKLKQRGVKGGVFRGLYKGLAAFLRSFVFKRGFLDGGLGVIVALSSAESAYYKYVKLAYLYRDTENEKNTE
ncbi:MAG: glycosyltransferase family 2 protein [Gammaproteobacteria bacterium]